MAGEVHEALMSQCASPAIHGVMQRGGFVTHLPASRMNRTNTAATPFLASHPQDLHGGCFGVYGTPSGKPFRAV
jgi:hypothetical protein